MFCNTILHTHIVLHLFVISNFSDCISLINTIKQDCKEKSKRRLKRRLFGKVEEDAQETSLSLQGPFTAFYRIYLSVIRRSPRFGFLQSTVSSPSPNQEPSLVCVVVIVQILTLVSDHFACFSHISFAGSGSGFKVERKNTIRQGLLLLLCLFICRFSSIGKSEYNHVYVFTNTLCAIVSIKINHV